MRLFLAWGLSTIALLATPWARAHDDERPHRHPPPRSGYPPNYYPPYPYPPQPYPQPYAYPKPHYGPPALPPEPSGPPNVVRGWDNDVPPPAGYFLDSDPNGSMIGVGVGFLTGGYVTAAIVGAVGSRGDGADPEDWIPLYIPIGGPFAAMFTLDTGPGSSGVLIANGIVQLGGLIGIIVGAVDREYKVVRSVTSVELTPTPGGIAIRGAF
jgi:hypothetical protein